MKTSVKIALSLVFMWSMLAAGGVAICLGAPATAPGATADQIMIDWLGQDLGKDNAKKCFKSKSDGNLEAEAVKKAAGELGAAGKALTAERVPPVA